MTVSARGSDATESRRAAGDTPHVRRRRAVWGAAGALLLLHIALAWAVRIPSMTTRNDDAFNVLLARALRGLSYREFYFVDAPVHAQYPPLYPGLLAITGGVFGDRVEVYLALGVALSAGALLLVFDAVRRHWPAALAVMVLGIAAVNDALVGNAAHILSETPFMFFVALTAWALARRPATRGWLVLAGAAAVAGALTRLAGVAVIGGLFLFWLFERRFKAAALLAVVSSVTVGAWLAWLILAPEQVAGRSYVGDALYTGAANPGAASASDARAGTALAEALLRRVVRNVPEYLASGIPWALPLPTVQGTAVDNAAGLLALAVLLPAGLVAMWRRWRGVPFLLVAYGGLLVIWPYVDARFLQPMNPLLIALTLVGAHLIGDRLGARFGRRLAWAMPLVLTLIIAGTALARDTALVRDMSRCDRADPTRSAGCYNADQLSFFAATRWVAQNAPETAIYYSTKDAAFPYFTGRTVLPLPAAKAHGPRGLVEYFAERGVSYVLLTHLTMMDLGTLGPGLSEGCAKLDLVQQFPPRTYLFRIAADRPPEPEGAACAAMARWRDATGPVLPVLR